MKHKVMRFSSGLLYVAAVIFLYKGITASSGGSMLDFSGTARAVLCSISVLLVISATFAWRGKDPAGKKRNSIAMIVLSLLFVLCAYVGTAVFNPPATEYTAIDLPFEVEDVAYVEMYHYEGTPENAQKKVVTEEQSILYLYTAFEECMLQEKKYQAFGDVSVTCFRFVLNDASSYELIYQGYGVKKGYLQSPTGGYTYFTPADIGWNWEMLDSTLAF